MGERERERDRQTERRRDRQKENRERDREIERKRERKKERKRERERERERVRLRKCESDVTHFWPFPSPKMTNSSHLISNLFLSSASDEDEDGDET